MSDFRITGSALTREQYLAREANRAPVIGRHSNPAFYTPPEPPPRKYRPSGAEQRKARKEREGS